MKWFTPDWQAGETNLDDGGGWGRGVGEIASK